MSAYWQWNTAHENFCSCIVKSTVGKMMAAVHFTTDNTLRIPNTALRKPNWYSTQAGTYEADIGSFLCWQRKRTRCDIENWGHFLPASWPTTLSQHVADNNFVPATEFLSKKRACRTRKTAVAVRSRFFYPRHVPAVMKFIIILRLLYFCLMNIHFFSFRIKFYHQMNRRRNL